MLLLNGRMTIMISLLIKWIFIITTHIKDVKLLIIIMYNYFLLIVVIYVMLI